MDKPHFFLKAKHWQLFMLSWGIGLIYIISFLLFLFLAANSTDPQNFFSFSFFFSLFPYICLIIALIQISWVWKVSTALNRKFHPSKSKTNIFLNISFVMALLTFLFFIGIYLTPMGTSLDNTNSKVYDAFLMTTTLVIVIVYLGSLIFSISLIAKVLRNNEAILESKFPEPSQLFILIWMFPAGIWVIQPIINEIFNSEN